MLRRLTANRAVRLGLALLAVGLGVLATVGHWQEARATAGTLDAAAVAAAAAAVLAGIFATMLAWRAVLADLGSVLSVRAAMRVFFLGQLGKYLPGSVWWLVGQVELAADAGVPRRRSAAAGAVAVVLSLVSGLMLAAVSVPLLAFDAAARYWPVLAGVPLLLATLHPRVINAVLGRLLRIAGRDRLEHPLTGRGVRRAIGYSGAAWLAFGAQVAVLAANLGAAGPAAVVLSIGGFALAWSVGFLAVVVPAGIGVREAALVAVLAPVLPARAALVIAVLSRVLMAGADLAWAGIAAAGLRRHRPAAASGPSGPPTVPSGPPAGTSDPPAGPGRSDRVEPV